jgi:N-acetylglutamate synthase-like GNAT family acetyltransferase
VRIRRATMDDIVEVQAVLQVLRKPEIPWADWHTRRDITPRLRDGRYYAAEIKGTIVAVMSLGMRPWHKLEIETLAVRRSCHGQGIGQRLVRFAESLAKRRGAKRVVVGSACIYGAGPFYRRMGFRVGTCGKYRGRKWYEYVLAV